MMVGLSSRVLGMSRATNEMSGARFRARKGALVTTTEDVQASRLELRREIVACIDNQILYGIS